MARNFTSHASGVAIKREFRGIAPDVSVERLTVLGWMFRMNGTAWVAVRCVCGITTVVKVYSLRTGLVRSCGCLHDEQAAVNGRATIHLASIASRTHGMSGSRLHRIWRGIKQRCYNQNSSMYKWYGAKGVVMCEEWRESFATFAAWAMANGYSDDLTIDRRQKTDSYSPEHCRWVTRAVNAAMAQWRHGRQASLVIPANIETSFDKTLTPGRGGKRHPENCPPSSAVNAGRRKK